MSAPFATTLLERMRVLGPICPGIDAHPGVLMEWGLPVTAAGARELGYRVVEAAEGLVAVVKPQVAFFERYGSAGYAALEDVLARCRQAGLLVIADAKRGDIGSSCEGYADAWLDPGSPLASDAVTASAYLGYGTLRPMVERAAAGGRGVFVLAVTSNPEGAGVQLARPVHAASVAASIAHAAARDNSAHRERTGEALGPVGLVIGVTSGATIASSGIDLAASGGLILAPGLGAQGGTPADVGRLFGNVRDRVVVAVGRDLLGHGPHPGRLAQRLQALVADTQAALRT